MRHADNKVRLSRTSSHRRALMRNLATSLYKFERIVTTAPKAKAARSYAEKIITRAKNAILESEKLIAEKKDKEAAVVLVNAKREIGRDIRDAKVMDKIFKDIALRYKTRNGGYTRIMKLGFRQTDGAERAILELVLE
jgi:large subunit ribosomal protein L17